MREYTQKKIKQNSVLQGFHNFSKYFLYSSYDLMLFVPHLACKLLHARSLGPRIGGGGTKRGQELFNKWELIGDS